MKADFLTSLREVPQSAVSNVRRVDLTFLLDRSNSMLPHTVAVIRGFDRMVQDQRQVSGEAQFTLNQFAGEVDEGETESLLDVLPLAVMGYHASGSGTALLDSLAKTISQIDHRLKINDAVVVIITDGEENASVRESWSTVKAMVLDRLLRGWKFILIGANQDAQKTAERLGIPADCALTFAPSMIGFRAAFRAASTNLLSWRCGGLLGFTDSQRSEQRHLLAERNE